MTRSFIKTASLIAAILLISTAAHARKFKSPFDFEPVTAEDWAVNPDTSQQIFDAAMIFEKVWANDKDMQDDDCYLTIYRRIRILGESGRKWADVAVPFRDVDQRIAKINAHTLLPNGTQIDLDAENIVVKEVVKTKEFKFKQTSFSIPGVTDDCIIEYIISIKSDYVQQAWSIVKEIPLLKFEYTWELAQFTISAAYADYLRQNPIADITVPNYLWLNSKSKQSVEKLPSIKETKIIRFTAANIAPFEEEPYGLPSDYLKERLICYYGGSQPPASFWGSLSNGFTHLAGKFAEDDDRVKKLVERWNDLPTDSAKIEAAYYWVMDSITNLSYVDLLDEKGKKATPKDRESVNDLLKRGYGTSYEIHQLFWDMLREMNIEARIGWVRSRSDDLFVFDAKYWQFTHSLVLIEDAEWKFRAYSPGRACTPIDCNPWYTEGVNALVGESADYVVVVPFSPPKVSREYHRNVITIDEELGVTSTINEQLTGHPARSMRIALYDEEETDFDDLLKDEIEEYYPDREIDSISFENREDLESAFKLNYTVTFDELSPVGDKLLIRPFDYCPSSDNPFTAEERSGPILFDFGYEATDAIEIHLPEGWHVSALPSDTSYTGIPGMVGVSLTNLQTKVMIQRRFKIESPYWRMEQYPMVKGLFQARQQMANMVIVAERDQEEE